MRLRCRWQCTHISTTQWAHSRNFWPKIPIPEPRIMCALHNKMPYQSNQSLANGCFYGFGLGRTINASYIMRNVFGLALKRPQILHFREMCVSTARSDSGLTQPNRLRRHVRLFDHDCCSITCERDTRPTDKYAETFVLRRLFDSIFLLAMAAVGRKSGWARTLLFICLCVKLRSLQCATNVVFRHSAEAYQHNCRPIEWKLMRNAHLCRSMRTESETKLCMQAMESGSFA